MKRHIKSFILFSVIVLTIFCSCNKNSEFSFSKNVPEFENYQLEQVVIFSRHNMRAPLATKDSVLGQLTPYDWPEMSSASGELTTLGGLQETAMGQYFRKYLVYHNLMEENWVPEENQVRFYSNSLQRTIATAHYFSCGMFPVANIKIEKHMSVGTMDPVFNPCLTYLSDGFVEKVQQEIMEKTGSNSVENCDSSLSANYKILDKLLNFKDSKYAKDNNLQNLPLGGVQIKYEIGKEPAMTGGLKLANTAADSFIMQYYEQADSTKASFGKKLSFAEWQKIGDISTLYQSVIFGSPTMTYNIAHPLLMELRKELTTKGRVFTMLCGHDSNVEPILVALDAEHFEVKDNISTKTPIGCKIVIEKWRGEDGDLYCSICLVYQDSLSLRQNKRVTIDEPPTWIELSLKGLEKNKDGLYRFEDVLARFDKAISAYDEITKL